MTSEGGGSQLVVLGVDGSAEPVAALGWAARCAAATGATVRAILAGTTRARPPRLPWG